jgi:hypothetical protein
MASPVPNNEGTRFKRGEKQVEVARKGGIASGESKRARKTLKEELLILLENGDTQEQISLAVIKKALEGDIKAYETIRDTIGEKPVEKTQNDVSVSYETLIKEVEDKHEY